MGECYSTPSYCDEATEKVVNGHMVWLQLEGPWENYGDASEAVAAAFLAALGDEEGEEPARLKKIQIRRANSYKHLYVAANSVARSHASISARSV